LSGFADLQDFQAAHRQWVEQGLENGLTIRDDRWSEAIAVGSRPFVEKVKGELGLKATYREVIEADGTYALREAAQLTDSNSPLESEALRSQNTVFWDETVDEVRT
jgi:putative transposase